MAENAFREWYNEYGPEWLKTAVDKASDLVKKDDDDDEKKKKYIELETKTQNFIFDHVIFANHADETLNILKKVNLSDKK